MSRQRRHLWDRIRGQSFGGISGIVGGSGGGSCSGRVMFLILLLDAVQAGALVVAMSLLGRWQHGWITGTGL